MGSIAINDTTLNVEPGAEVILSLQSWADYERLLSLRDERLLPKIYFNADSGKIRLMSPLPAHGKRTQTLADLVKIILRSRGKKWDSFDPITLKQGFRGGVEPDICFYIDNRSAILGKDKIDLAIDPPPDLAIEVDITSRSDIDDYIPIAIPEVWIYQPSQLLIYGFNNGAYEEIQLSTLFTDIDIKAILPIYVEMAWHQGSSIALDEFEKFLAI